MLHILLVFLLLILLIFLGFPIYFATGISSIIVIFAMELPFSLIIVKIFGGIDSFMLMAIPFFILAGNLMMESGITDRIVGFSDALVGRFRGGLGHVNIASSMLFAGIQGSGVADASAIGSIMIPTMAHLSATTFLSQDPVTRIAQRSACAGIVTTRIVRVEIVSVSSLLVW